MGLGTAVAQLITIRFAEHRVMRVSHFEPPAMSMSAHFLPFLFIWLAYDKVHPPGIREIFHRSPKELSGFTCYSTKKLVWKHSLANQRPMFNKTSMHKITAIP